MTAETKILIEQRTDLTNRLKKVLIERLDLKSEPNEIAEDAPLFGMGLALDSIDALVLIVGIEDEFNITIDSGDYHIYRSINTVVDYLMQLARNQEKVAANA